MKIPLGVPATDAVSLSANQSRILALEEKYLVPFLQRTTEFSSHDPPASTGLGGSHFGGGEDGHGVSPSAPDMAPGASLGATNDGHGSFIANDHIDHIFGYTNQSSMVRFWGVGVG